MLVHDFLTQSARRYPDKIALVSGDQRLSYGQIDDLSGCMAASLIDLGLQRQDRVIIFLDNSAESVISLFGILKAGAIFVMLNPAMKPKKLGYILKDSGARMLVTHRNKFRVVAEALKHPHDLTSIIWNGNTDNLPLTSVSSVNHRKWSEVQTPPARSEIANQIIDVDLATIIYTSGSTGDPKGVMSAHYNVCAAARSITQYLGNVEEDIILSALPLSFDYGLYQILMASLFGGTVVLEKSFVYPYKVLEKLVQEKATGFPIVPTMVALLLQMEELKNFDLSSLRYISNTAAALPVSYIRRLQGILPNHTKIFSMYGLTECKRVSYLPPEYIDSKPDSVGIPMPNEEVLILDENGKPVAPGQTGELVVRGSNVMQGYWKSPEETARTFRPGRYRGDALLYSGDLFRQDEDGFLYFVSRKDDMIKTKGERVSPKEIETALCEMDGVVEAAVIGVPDDIFGQAIKAFIKPTKNQALTEKSVMNFCLKNLEPFMVPKYVEFVNGFDKTSSGKIDKKKLT